MKQTLTPEQKNKIITYTGAGLVFLLLLSLTIIALVTTQRQSRDIERLAAISELRTDLLKFYNERSIFPESIKVYSEVKKDEECDDSLCLNKYPTDPMTGERYVYTPCYDANSENCEAGAADAQGYKIGYHLESSSSLVKPGDYYATGESLLNF